MMLWFLQHHLICGYDSGLRVECLHCQQLMDESSREAAAYLITQPAPNGWQDVIRNFCNAFTLKIILYAQIQNMWLSLDFISVLLTGALINVRFKCVNSVSWKQKHSISAILGSQTADWLSSNERSDLVLSFSATPEAPRLKLSPGSNTSIQKNETHKGKRHFM